MAMNARTIEELAAFCAHSDDPVLAAQRDRARALFFGEADPRPVRYDRDTDTRASRLRRFIGWFMFQPLPIDGTEGDLSSENMGRTPAEIAVERLYAGPARAEALSAVRGARYVFGAVASVSGRTVFLEVGPERYEVRAPEWANRVRLNEGVAAHLVPVRRSHWLPAPGWVLMSLALGPGFREALPDLQADAIETERLLQRRAAEGDVVRTPPRDDTLAGAVERMRAWAEANDCPNLALSMEEWRQLVLRYLEDDTTTPSEASTAYAHEVMERSGAEPQSLEQLQQVLDLSNNIWNNTPQPRRGNRSANELRRVTYGKR